MSGGLTTWQMYVIFAFGQCKHVNSSMMSDLQWYWWLFITATIFYFCTVFALYFFNDCIAHTATVQKGVRNSGDISVTCSFLAL